MPARATHSVTGALLVVAVAMNFVLGA